MKKIAVTLEVANDAQAMERDPGAGLRAVTGADWPRSRHELLQEAIDLLLDQYRRKTYGPTP
jgi:hypothetical protein